ncbi:MAG: lipoprotein [Salaquimonas sp.]
MTNGTFRKTTLGLALLIIALGISSCGRKGALEAPPSAQITSEDATKQQTEPEKPDNPFFLDALI